MKARILYTDPETGHESEENIRYTDEIAEADGMTDEELAAMENELRSAGRYHLRPAQNTGGRCAYAMR